jgi:hypothetical protein
MRVGPEPSVWRSLDCSIDYTAEDGGDVSGLADEQVELFGENGLRAIGQRAVRIVVHLYE